MYSSNDAGAPALTNTYGSLAGLLKTVLVTGYGDTNITSIIKLDDKKIKVVSNVELLFQLESVVYFKNITGHENTRFHVKEIVDNNTLILKNYDGVDLISFGTDFGSGILYRKGLGFNILYEDFANATKRKIVFTNRNGWNLRIHDEQPTETSLWTASWAKGARVSWGREMTNIDTWATYPKNYVASRPTSWKSPTRVGLSGTPANNSKISENAWYYATKDNQLVNAPNDGTRNWTIIGNDTTFYLWINPQIDTNYSMQMCYGFGEFDTLIYNDVNNAFLISYVNSYMPSTGAEFYVINRNRSCFNFNSTSVYDDQNDLDYYYKYFQLASKYNQSTPNYPTHAGLKWLTGNGTGIYSGFTSNFTMANNGIANSMIYSPMYINEYGGILRGVLKGAKAIIVPINSFSQPYSLSNDYFFVDASEYEDDDRKFIIKTQTTGDLATSSIMFNLYEDWDV